MFDFPWASNITDGERLEIGLLLLIAIAQVAFSIQIIRRIHFFRGIFNRKLTSIDNQETLVRYTGNNPIMSTIQETINTYLYENKGGVIDFHILKDIVDRNVEITEDEISIGISTPLYLGLAGTMIGIVIGLFYLDLSPAPSTAVVSGISSIPQMFDVSPLINGIKYAMSVSVLGLLLTTALSVWIFRPAKKYVNIGKNAILSILQTELLPSLVKSDSVAMQELSRQLGHFSRNTPEYLTSLSSNTEKLRKNLESEIELIHKIQGLDIREMSKSNIRVFDHLSEMMDSFEQFPAYYNELNSSMGNTIALNNNLKDLVSRTDNVNTIIQEIKEIIETGQEATTFFNAHIKDFSRYSDSVNQAVADTDKRFKDALDQLDRSVEKQYESFAGALIAYESKLSKAFESATIRLNEAYKTATPNFDNLNELPSINKKLDQLEVLNDRFDKLIHFTQHNSKSIGDQQRIVLPDIEGKEGEREETTPNRGNGGVNILKEIVFYTYCVSIITFVIYIIFLSK